MQELTKTSAAITSGLGKMHRGAQLFVAYQGDEFDTAFGDLTSDHQTLWMSSVKPITAVAVAQLWQRGKLNLDDPVAKHLPAFGTHGKEAVSIRHLLTHTGGFRAPHITWKPQQWDELIAHVCDAKLEPRWIPGRKAGYHSNTSWYILAELVQRLDGREIQGYLREEVFLPLGMEASHLGIPETLQDERVAPVYEPDEDGALQARAALNDPRIVALPRPGGNGRGPARELGRFYQAMLAGGGGIISPQTVAAITARHRVGLYDYTFRHEMDWGLGFIIDSKRHGIETVPYGYGDFSSLSTFGHSGSQSSTGFADPENDLVVVLIFDGMPGEMAHQSRIRACLNALYQDLGLAESDE